MRNGKSQKRDVGLLEDCIEHWKRDVVGQKSYGDINIESRACALCEEYLLNCNRFCRGCPVRNYTGNVLCEESPYDKVKELYLKWKETGKKHKGFEAVVKKEIAFLKKLHKEAKAQFAKKGKA